jgi:hypothetical protein
MKLLTIFAALLAAFAVGGGLALATGGGSSSGVDLTGSTTEIGTTTGADEAGDISGPCDEAEHANDPRCTGANPADSSGPGPGGQDEDNSGPGSGGDDVDHDDNSGSGSGSRSGPSGSG